MRYKFVFILVLLFYVPNASAFSTRTANLFDNSFWHNDKSYIHLGVIHMSENIDPFDFIEDELSTINAGSAVSIGETKGINLSLNKKIFPYLSGEVKLQRADYDFGYDSLKVNTYSGKLNFTKTRGNFTFAASIGAEFMDSEDIKMKDPDSMNNMIKRISPGSHVKFAKHSDGYWIDLGNGGFVRSGTDSKNISPSIKISGSDSFTYYGGGSIHYKLNSIYSGLFFEYGKTDINSKLDTTIDDFLGDLQEYLTVNQKKLLEKFPKNFERDETFLTLGTYFQFPLFFKLEGNLSFAYIWIERDTEIDYEPENFALSLSVLYPLTEKISLNFGGQYLYRQLNGVVPFLYNKYTQTTFDHKYGYLHAGLTYSF